MSRRLDERGSALRTLSMALIVLTIGAPIASAQSISVDLAQRHQTIIGFGGFGGHTVSWEPGPYFDDVFIEHVVDGLGATIMRVGISPDLEPVNDNADANNLDMSRFQFGEGTENGAQLALVRAIHDKARRSNVTHKFIATVWTPPGWMKIDAKDELAPFCRDARCGGKLNPKMREELAEYLVAYVRAFKQATGADLYALSIQNELLFENAFDSCTYDAKEFAATLKVVSARLAKEHLKVLLFGPEHMGSYKWNDESGLLSATLDDPEAARALDAYAVHSYIDGISPDFGSADGWTALHGRVEKAGKPLWMSETSRDEVTYDDCFDMTRALHLALKHGHVSAWVYWTYANHLFINKQPSDLYHLLRGYFRFVRPGAVHVQARAGDASLLVTAFSESDALTVVVINNGATDKVASLRIDHGKALGTWSATRTSRTEHSLHLGTVDVTSIAFPAQSITTLVSGQPGGEAEPAIIPSRDRPSIVAKPTSSCRCAVIGGDPGVMPVVFVLIFGASLLLRRARARSRIT